MQNIIAPLLQAELPMPPGVNQSYKIVRVRTKAGQMRHRLAATKELEQFKEVAATLLKQAKKNPDAIDKARIAKAGLAADIRFYHPDARRRDVDGNIKALLDACFEYMDPDDTLVVDLHATKTIDRDNPHCEISIGFAEIGG